MNIKKLALALGLSASFGVMVACNESSTAASGDDTKGSSSAEEITSSESNAGSEDIESSESKVESSASEKATSSESKAESSASEDVTSSESNEGSASSISIIDYKDLKACTKVGDSIQVSYEGKVIAAVCDEDHEWVLDIDQVDDIIACTTDGETKDTVIAGETLKLVCEDGLWVFSEDNKKCEEEGATKELNFAAFSAAFPLYAPIVTAMLGDVSSVNLICKDGEWTLKEEPCTDGDTKEIMGFPMVCKDGEWGSSKSLAD